MSVGLLAWEFLSLGCFLPFWDEGELHFLFCGRWGYPKGEGSSPSPHTPPPEEGPTSELWQGLGS
jgi:hypothetical protein